MAAVDVTATERSRPCRAPTPAFREGVNVLLARTEEIQKVHAHVFAGFAEAQNDDSVANSPARAAVAAADDQRLCRFRASL